MVDKNSDESSSSTKVGDGNGDSTVMINVKTLDSRVFPFRASKNMTVMMLKEKIADVTGTPVVQQRLIFRGKVLKDDHLLSSYYAEDGDTFHLVARQPVQNENQPVTSSAATIGNTENSGTGATGGVPWNRSGVVGQISHNVVLGPITLGIGGESPSAADVNRVIRSLVNSMGLAPPENVVSAGNSTSANAANIAVSSSSSSATNPSGNPLPSSSNLFPFPIFNQHLVATPNSLATLASFIHHLEQALGSYGYQSQAPGSENPPRLSSLSSNSSLLRPESLGMVMSEVQRLLHGQVTAALTHITGLLERQTSITDPFLRNEIQNQSAYVGVTLQHLGAMLLELGRTTLALRMGESPAEGFVTAGPAVYISATGPVPIMVQPALHTTPLPGFSRSIPLAVNAVHVHSTGTAVGLTEREGPTGGSAQPQSTVEESSRSIHPPNAAGNNAGQSETNVEISAPLPAGEGPATEDGTRSAGEDKKEKKTAPLGLGLGGLQPKRKVKQQESQLKAKSMAMGQQVLQSLAESGAGGGSSSSQSSGPLQGVDFSRLLNQMMPVVSQALGVAGPTDGPHSGNAPHHADPGEEGITQTEIGRVIERLVNGDSRGSVFQAMVETASRLYRESGGGSFEDLSEALSEDNELSDDFFEMLRRGGAGSRGS